MRARRIAGGPPAGRTHYRQLKPHPGSAGEKVAAHQLGRIQLATIELVARLGYEGLTVEAIRREAGVSKRAFYEHFDGKEACFLATYDLIVREMTRGILSTLDPSADWEERMRSGFAAFADEIARQPEAAHLALVDIYVDLPGAMDRVRHTAGLLETLLAQTFATADDGIEVPPQIHRAIVGAGGAVARARLLAGAAEEFRSEAEALLGWALSLRAPEAAVAFATPMPRVPARAVPTPPVVEGMSEREAILAVAAEISATEDHTAVSARRVAEVLGLARCRVARQLPGRGECLLAALDHHGRMAIAEVRGAVSSRSDWPEAIASAVAVLCARLDADPVLARLVLGEVFEAGRPATAWRSAKLRGLAALVRSTTPPEFRPTRLQAEASVAGVWALLASAAREGGTGGLCALAPGLTYVLLAPVIGAEVAGSVVGGMACPTDGALARTYGEATHEREPVPGC